VVVDEDARCWYKPRSIADSWTHGGSYMLVANDCHGTRTFAWLAQKSGRPFCCPECQKEVIPHQGPIRAAHFAHKPPVTCSYGRGESDLHYKAKRAIFDALSAHPKCRSCDVETRLPGVRADVVFALGPSRVAVEFQKSTIDVREVQRRTEQYTRLGFHALWLVADQQPTNVTVADDGSTVIARPKEWQKYLHALHFGRLYHWQNAAIVKAYHLEPHKYYVERGNWVEDFEGEIGDSLEGTHWHDENYESADYGGYWKTSKTKKQVIPASSIGNDGELHIAEHFQPSNRKEFQAKNWTVPAGLVWMDRYKKWW
jgi:competence protein CoiA